jgi:predicted nucleic acid-binding protein
MRSALYALHVAIAHHHGLARIATADMVMATAAEALRFKVDFFA